MTTRLSKSMTSARSCDRSFFANPMAASCAVPSLVSMLALVSRSSASAIGRLVRFKNVEVFLRQVGDVAGGAVGDRDVERHEIDAGTERRLLPLWRLRLRGRGL